MLAIVFSFVTLTSAVVVTTVFAPINLGQYLNAIVGAFTGLDIAVFVFKNALFGFIIGSIACFHGLKIEESVTEIPQQTQKAIVSTLSVISAWRNVLLSVNYHDLGDPAKREERARRLIEAMPGAADPAALPAHMSQLQHMHMTAARSLMLEPAFLFAEDPFRGLEGDERQRLGEFLARTGPCFAGTVVISTDDATFARDYAERILLVSPEGHVDFGDWAALRASDDDAVRAYLRQRSAGKEGPEEEA